MRKIQYRLRVKRRLDAAGHKYEALPEDHEADFVVYPQDGGPAFNVRVFGRCRVEAKKRKDNMRYAFPDPSDSDNCDVYMYPHDEFLTLFIEQAVGRNAPPDQWKNDCRHWPKLPDTVRDALIKHGFTL